jgi:hypothetical protein
MVYKKSYFQGTEEPTPKKKKYKSEPKLIDQPRFKEPFYRNYDLYDVDGEHGPGAGWNSMHKFKSVKDFLDARRKKLKNKYVADPQYVHDDGSIKSKAIARSKLLIKIAIDFPLDNYSSPETESPDNPVAAANYIGGFSDKYLPNNDPEDKSSDKLNFSRDLDEKAPINLEKLLTKYINPGNSALLGNPDGVDDDAKDATQTNDNSNPYYGTTDSHNDTYKNTDF